VRISDFAEPFVWTLVGPDADGLGPGHAVYWKSFAGGLRRNWFIPFRCGCVGVAFLIRFDAFAEIGLSRAKLTHSFIDIIMEAFKEPCVCRRRKEQATKDRVNCLH
jgi:hypothetical protein